MSTQKPYPSLTCREVDGNETVLSFSSNASTVKVCNIRPGCRKIEEVRNSSGVLVSNEDIASSVAAFGAFADALPNSIDRFWFLQFFQYFDTSDVCMIVLREFMAKISTKLAVSQDILLQAKKACRVVAGLPLHRVQPFLSKLPPQRAQVSFEEADQSHVSGAIGNGDIFQQLNSLTDECFKKVGAQGESVSAPSDENDEYVERRDPDMIVRSPSAIL